MNYVTSSPQNTDDVTLVTAYFDIGSFQKGTMKGNTYSPGKYAAWMEVFEFIDNPLYVYVDNTKFSDFFKVIRENSNLFHKTKFIIVDRKNLWAFSLQKNISTIFSNPKYPKFYPNTVNANYSCAMHAKYEVMKKSVEDNAFKTKYFAWIDIGLFRDEKDLKCKRQRFHIHTPENLSETEIAYSEVHTPINKGIKPIMHKNFVWVSGAFFIGIGDVMLKYTIEYMYYTEQFIGLKLINTDQQVIYAMRQPDVHNILRKPKVNIQTYHGGGYFGLGYLCRTVIQLNATNKSENIIYVCCVDENKM